MKGVNAEKIYIFYGSRVQAYNDKKDFDEVQINDNGSTSLFKNDELVTYISPRVEHIIEFKKVEDIQ